MTDEEKAKDARLTRQLIREELDASNSYEEKAQATSDPEAARVYRDISREEKVHAGELQALLDREDPEVTEAMAEGVKETGLEGSFEDIFKRKRAEVIYKSTYGTHLEKKSKDKVKQEIERQKQIESVAENYSKEGNEQVKTKARAGPKASRMTLGDLLISSLEGSPELQGIKDFLSGKSGMPVLTEEQKRNEILDRQVGTEDTEGEPRRIDYSELDRGGLRRNFGRPWQSVSGRGVDYDTMFEPQMTSDYETERFARQNAPEPAKGAPHSAKRPWLTFRYFGTHNLQSTAIPPRKYQDKDGNWHFRDRILMNYRISRVGKDTAFEQGMFQIKSVWDPNAYNPATRRNTGAYVPKGVALVSPNGTPLTDGEGKPIMVYDVDQHLTDMDLKASPTGDASYYRGKDPWEILEQNMARMALVEGVKRYSKDPEFKAKIDKISVADHLKGQRLTPANFDSNKLIAQLSVYYKDINEGLQAERERLASVKSQRDLDVATQASGLVGDYLTKWIDDHNIKGVDGSDVTADTLDSYLDTNTGTYHLILDGKEVVIPQDKMDAWEDHAREYFERQIRFSANEEAEQVQKAEDAAQERQRIEDSAISDYVYRAFRGEYEKNQGPIDWMSDVSSQIRQMARDYTQELLYGDGGARDRFIAANRSIGKVDDLRAYLLKQAGFDWNTFERNRQTLRALADRALTAEVSSMADPRFQQRVKEDIATTKASQKTGLIGVLATRTADKEFANLVNSNIDYAGPGAIQSYLNNKTASPMFDEKGNVSFPLRLLNKDTNPHAAPLMGLLRDELRSREGWVEPSDEKDWDRSYRDELTARIPKWMDSAVANVKRELELNPEFRAKILGADSMKPTRFGEDAESYVNAIASMSPEDLIAEMKRDPKMMRAVFNAGNMASRVPIDVKYGVSDRSKIPQLSYENGQNNLTRMFMAAMQGARDQTFRDLLPHLENYVENVIDGNITDFKSKQQGKPIFDEFARQNTRMAEEYLYNVFSADDPEADEETIKEMVANATPKEWAQAKENVRDVSIKATMRAIGNKDELAGYLAYEAGHYDPMMTITNLTSLSDEALYGNEKDFIAIQRGEVTPEEELNQRIAPYVTDEGSDRFEALVRYYMDRGYSQRQAGLRANEFLESRGLNLKDARRLELRQDVTPFGFGTKVEGGQQFQPLDYEGQRKLLRDALKSYFVKNYVPNIPEWDQMDGKARSQRMFETLAKEGLYRPVFGDPNDSSKQTGYAINWEAFERSNSNDQRYRKARDVLNSYIRSNMSLGQAGAMGLNMKDMKRQSYVMFDEAFDTLMRKTMVGNRAEAIKSENEGISPTAAWNTARREVDRAFPDRIANETSTRFGKEYLSKLEGFGIDRDMMQKIRVQAMRESDNPVYRDFVKPYFDTSGRADTSNRDSDEYGMFMDQTYGTLNNVQQNPALTESWNNYLNKPGTLSINHANTVADWISGDITRALDAEEKAGRYKRYTPKATLQEAPQATEENKEYEEKPRETRVLDKKEPVKEDVGKPTGRKHEEVIVPKEEALADAGPAPKMEDKTDTLMVEQGKEFTPGRANYMEAKNIVDSMNNDRGGGKVTREDVNNRKFKNTGGKNMDNTEEAKKSAMDRSFSDIMNERMNSVIRKNQTGTDITPEPVTPSMTEQTSAPREQSIPDTGGFAELMKSKMAETHSLEIPSEEREDWIPMRNGYRRVTIGGGKNCVHEMMRNPPRSANAPGARVRKV